jgi:hypothetical protein
LGLEGYGNGGTQEHNGDAGSHIGIENTNNTIEVERKKKDGWRPRIDINETAEYGRS